MALGDAHGNEPGEAFRLALIRDARFAAAANDIVVEYGNGRYQDLMDRFVRGERVSDDVLRQAWQNTTQPQAVSWEMPELFRVVREINASLPPARQLRVLLGDPPIEWENIRTADDLRSWTADGRPGDRDRYATALIEREVLAKQRHALLLYGAGHFFRKNQTFSIVSLLEGTGRTKVFTIWTNAGADLQTFQPDVASWPVPSLTSVRGTVLGRENFEAYFPSGTPLPAQWRVPMEDQFDAVLYLGPPSRITFARAGPWPCADPAFAERLRRIALYPLSQGQVERLEQTCTK